MPPTEKDCKPHEVQRTCAAKQAVENQPLETLSFIFLLIGPLCLCGFPAPTDLLAFYDAVF